MLKHSARLRHSLALLRLAKDQTEINRIIAEVSKGSKFYEVGDQVMVQVNNPETYYMDC